MATTITVRKVPDEVRNELATRAARSGRSLQEFMLHELTRITAKPTLDELLADIRSRKDAANTTVSTDSILADRDAERR